VSKAVSAVSARLEDLHCWERSTIKPAAAGISRTATITQTSTYHLLLQLKSACAACTIAGASCCRDAQRLVQRLKLWSIRVSVMAKA